MEDLVAKPGASLHVILQLRVHAPVAREHGLLGGARSFHGLEMIEKRPAPVLMVKPNEGVSVGGQVALKDPAHASVTIVGVMEHAQGHDHLERAFWFVQK